MTTRRENKPAVSTSRQGYTKVRGVTRVLTLYLAKDYVDEKCYRSVITQEGVSQDVIIVSAVPVNYPNNCVVKVREDFPLSVRVGLSINKVLEAYWNKSKSRYDYLFKVDNDLLLPPKFLQFMISKKRPLTGIGGAMLIKAQFFNKLYDGKWAVTLSDDEYMAFYAFAKGAISDIWEGNVIPVQSSFRLPSGERLFWAGKEHYRFGAPIWFMLIRLVVGTLRNLAWKKPYALCFFHVVAGYISAIGSNKYSWSGEYKYRITKLYLDKLSRPWRKVH